MSDTALSLSQSLVWAGQSLAPNTPLYNMAWRFDLYGALDAPRFIAAASDTIRASDAMTSVFLDTGGAPVRKARVDVPDVPLRDFSAANDPAQEAEDWMVQDAQTPFDLAHESYRTCLLKVAEDHWIWHLNVHHIATDAWSGKLLFEDVATRYEGAEPTHRPAFSTALHSQAQAADTDAIKAARSHWRSVENTHATATPAYNSTRDATATASRRIPVNFGPKRSAWIEQTCQSADYRSISADLSKFCLFATAYAAFLHRVTGDKRINIGAPAHNRMSVDDRATIGLLIEMFPLTVDIDDTDDFQTLYGKTRSAALTYLRHARAGATSAATSSLFNAVLNFIPVSYGAFGNLRTKVSWRHSGAHDAAHDMRLHVYDFNDTGEYVVEMDLNKAVFGNRDDPAAHLLSIFDAFIKDPSSKVAEVGLLLSDAAPTTHMIGPRSDAPEDVLSRFERVAQSTPDATAVRSGDTHVSYADLDVKAQSIAAALQTSGAHAGDAIVIHAHRSPDYVAAVLATLKIGAIFVPVPSDAPQDRLLKIIETAQAKAAIFDGPVKTRIGDLSIPVIDMAQDPAPFATQHVVTSETAAYAIFTSGSTGTPKGVQVARAGFARYIDWASRSYGPDGAKTYAFHSSIGFDLTLTSIFVPLVTGGTVVCYPETGQGPDLAVLKVFEEDAVDVVKLTPAHLSMVALHAKPVNRIETLILGGANLSTAQSRHALDRLGKHITIANEYGPTEAIVGAMIHTFDPARDTQASVPIGKPADDVSIYLLDAGLNPVPQGVAGEICIAGDRLAQGYLNAPDQTAEKFVADPFNDSQHMYRTGDIGVMLASGDLAYLGRSDDQIKLSGVRIEPAEIEAALTAHSSVLSAFVTTYPLPAVAASMDDGCQRCGIPEGVDGARIDAQGICNICHDFDAYKDKANDYFETPQELRAEIEKAAARKQGTYDAIMLLSGGKDSTYALYRVAEVTTNILTLTLDNGYISQGAKQNIDRVTKALGVDHRYLTTPAMNAVFRDSLERFSNVCQGCFKTIYTLALDVARREKVPAIITGLSRGQFFETRLTPELFQNENAPTPCAIDGIVKTARRAYHMADDTVNTLLDAPSFVDDALLDEVTFIDVYRYLDVPLSELYAYLSAKAPWVRPDDTGRSSNCLINDVGIYVHNKREGFHNYAVPYSWDVRLGHKTRQEAVDELNDTIDPERIKSILEDIGYTRDPDAPASPKLAAYVVGENLDTQALRADLTRRLPRELVPDYIIAVPELPITANGKVDRAALPRIDLAHMQIDAQCEPAGTDLEAQLLGLFREVIAGGDYGVTDNFYDIGGDSIAAIQIALRANELGLDLEPNSIFEHQTVRSLAAATQQASASTEQGDDEDLLDLDDSDLGAVMRAVSQAAERS